MSGLKVVVPTSFTDVTLPILHDDPVLTEGSLVLVDLAHPASTTVSGVPASGDPLPNVAWKEAARVLGSGDATTLAANWEKGSALSGSVGTIERSGKGGIHVILSATTSPGTGKGAGIRPAQAVADWIVDNPTHAYYASVWFKMTRYGENTANTAAISLHSSPSTSGALLYDIASAGTYPTTTARLGYRRSRDGDWRPSITAAVTPPFAEPLICNVAVNGYTGTNTLTGSSAKNEMALWANGMFAPFTGTHTVGASYGYQSKVFWRTYLEDLTVSGRTYSEVDALDFAEYTKQCLTSGGRYYADTYTDPATVA